MKRLKSLGGINSRPYLMDGVLDKENIFSAEGRSASGGRD
jgi:hypothetical protein